MHIVASAKRVHMIFKQKQRLGCIYHSEIQAYLGSGVKKINSVFFHFFLHHWPFICHLIKNWSMGGIFLTLFFIVFSLYIYCIKECDWTL